MLCARDVYTCRASLSLSKYVEIDKLPTWRSSLAESHQFQQQFQDLLKHMLYQVSCWYLSLLDCSIHSDVLCDHICCFWSNYRWLLLVHISHQIFWNCNYCMMLVVRHREAIKLLVYVDRDTSYFCFQVNVNTQHITMFIQGRKIIIYPLHLPKFRQYWSVQPITRSVVIFLAFDWSNDSISSRRRKMEKSRNIESK